MARLYGKDDLCYVKMAVDAMTGIIGRTKGVAHPEGGFGHENYPLSVRHLLGLMLSRPLQFWDRPAEQLPGYVELLNYRPTAPPPPEPQPVAEVVDTGVVGETMNEESENEMRGPPPLVPAPHLQQNAADREMDRVFTSPSARTIQFERAMFQEPSRGDITVLGARGSQAAMIVEVPGSKLDIESSCKGVLYATGSLRHRCSHACRIYPVWDAPATMTVQGARRRRDFVQLASVIRREVTLRVRRRLHRSLSTSVPPVSVRDQSTREARKGVPTDEGLKAVMDRQHHLRMGKKKKLTDKGIRVKSVPAVTGNWSGTEDVSDEEIGEVLARADESMEAEKAILRLQAATTSTEQEPMEIPGEDIPVATIQEVYTVEESDAEVDLDPSGCDVRLALQIDGTGQPSRRGTPDHR